MREQHIEKLIQKYMDGLTTAAEERALAETLCQEKDHPEWEVIRTLLLVSPLKVNTEALLQEDETLAYQEVIAKHNKKNLFLRIKRLSIAAAVLIVAGVIVWRCLNTNVLMQKKLAFSSTSQVINRNTTNQVAPFSCQSGRSIRSLSQKQKSRSREKKFSKKAVVCQSKNIRVGTGVKDSVTIRPIEIVSSNKVGVPDLDTCIETEYSKVYQAAYAHRKETKRTMANLY